MVCLSVFARQLNIQSSNKTLEKIPAQKPKWNGMNLKIFKNNVEDFFQYLMIHTLIAVLQKSESAQVWLLLIL